MKVQTIKKDFRLKNDEIEAITRQITEFLELMETEKRARVRVSLSVEEALLRYQEHLGTDKTGQLVIGKFMGRPYISVSVEGEEFNPFELFDDEVEDIGYYSNHLLENLGVAPIYTREKGKNRLLFKLKKQSLNPIVQLVIAVVAALIAGFAGIYMPEQLVTTLADGLITPVCDTAFNVLGAMAGPVTFLSVTWGIYGIGDAAVFGRIGKRMIIHFITMMGIITIIVCAVSLPFFELEYSVMSGGKSQFAAIVELLLGFFPKDVFSPFIDGNFLQIVLMAFIAGIALLVLSRQTTIIAGAVEQLNYIVQYVMEFIGKLIPALVFIILVQLMWSGSMGVAVNSLKPVVIITVTSLAAGLVLLLGVAVIFKANPAILLRKSFKTFAIAATTASSAAAFSTCVDTCEKQLGIESRIPKFGVPVGISLFPISTSITYMLICLYMAEVYEVECSFMWLVMLVFTSMVLSVATPPIPGGAVACYAIMFLQLGIPEAGLGIALALDVILDFVVTGVNVFALQFELVLQANKMNLIDRDVLRAR